MARATVGDPEADDRAGSTSIAQGCLVFALHDPRRALAASVTDRRSDLETAAAVRQERVISTGSVRTGQAPSADGR